MGGLNRGRYTIAIGDGWRLYQATQPPGWKMLGVIERGGERGALACSPAGLYAQINAGGVRSLIQTKVQAAIAAAGGMQ